VFDACEEKKSSYFCDLAHHAGIMQELGHDSTSALPSILFMLSWSCSEEVGIDSQLSFPISTDTIRT
jgi:hypothetical protein